MSPKQRDKKEKLSGRNNKDVDLKICWGSHFDQCIQDCCLISFERMC